MSKKSNKKTVLFVCTGNTCRSPMAEWYFNSKLKKNSEWKAISAGLLTSNNSPASFNSIDVMKEIDINIEKHQSKNINEKIINNSFLVLTMSENHKLALIESCAEWKEKVFTLIEYVSDNKVNDIDIFDPFGSDIDFYRKTRDNITECIDKLFKIHQIS